MTDETRIRERAARDLAENPLLVRLFDEAERAAFNEFANSDPTAVEAREVAYATYRGVRAFRGAVNRELQTARDALAVAEARVKAEARKQDKE